jgi:DNA-binding MarR family transcriptional regulator
LAYLFKHADRRMAELHAEALAPFGIQARDLGVLLAIDGGEPASQQQVAERMGVDRTTMVAIVDDLEAKGIVVRRPDPIDRRRNVVSITPDGQRILREAIAASDLAEAQLLAPLSAEEGEQLRRALARLLRSD